MLRFCKRLPFAIALLLTTFCDQGVAGGLFGDGGLLGGGPIPGVPGLPSLPGVGGIPGVPGIPGIPGIPIPGGPLAPPFFPVPPANIPKCITTLAGGAFGVGLPGVPSALGGGGIPGLPLPAPGIGVPGLPIPGVGIPGTGPSAPQILKDCLSDSGTTVPAQPPLEPTAATNAPVVPVAPTMAMVAARQPIDLIFYSFYECKVDWHHYCDGLNYLALLDSAGVPQKDWQVCKPLFTVKNTSGITSGPAFNPSKWYTRDPILPANYRRLQLQIHANGNNIPPVPGLPSQGAAIRLEQVGIRLIVQDASFEERVEGDCDFPPTP